MIKRSLYKGSCAVGILMLAFVAAALGQTTPPAKPEVKPAGNGPAASAAYAEVLLKKTDLQSELESLIIDYTEEFPKVMEIRLVLLLLDRDIARLGRVKPADTGKLTLALGKLMLRKVELETDVWKLQKSYKDDHPDVKRAKRRVEIYETAVSEILN